MYHESDREDELLKLTQELAERDAALLKHKNRQYDFALELKTKTRRLREAQEQIERLSADRDRFEALAGEYRAKSEKFDTISLGLNDIRLTAESVAFKLVDGAKIQAMETIGISDRVCAVVSETCREVQVFRQKSTELPDGQAEQLRLLEECLWEAATEIEGLKAQFYIENSI